MNAITINKALNNLPLLINNTVNNFEETIIIGEQGNVVLVAQREWDSLMETVKLLKDKQSLRALIESHNNRKKGEVSEGKSIKQAFYDL